MKSFEKKKILKLGGQETRKAVDYWIGPGKTKSLGQTLKVEEVI